MSGSGWDIAIVMLTGVIIFSIGFCAGGAFWRHI